MTVLVEDPRLAFGSGVNWPAIFAGAIAAAALALVLHTFAAAIGLAVSSTAPTWRDGSVALWILSGIYLILVALASYGLGGYVAGWVRTWSERIDDASDTTDGIHGLLAWAVATLITALVVATTAIATAQLAAPSGGNAGPAASVGSENLIAYDVDRLFRNDGRAPTGDHARAEAGRILLKASGHSGVSSEDRAYLTRLVAAQTGLGTPDAERRVDTAIVGARDNIHRARRSAVILAFMAGAAGLLGAAAAWFAASIGARHGGDPAGTSIWSNQRVTSFP